MLKSTFLVASGQSRRKGEEREKAADRGTQLLNRKREKEKKRLLDRKRKKK